MEVLILSCKTGGGHNTAAEAVKEELERRGHHTVFLDPYLLAGPSLDRTVGNAYVKLVQGCPKAFGTLYQMGEVVRRIPLQSPVYYANAKIAKKLGEYMAEHSFDCIVMTHLFPAEMITWLKRKGYRLPPCVFIATDYTCIPFTEETDCDYYIIPSEELTEEFVRKGIEKEKIKPLGIPVRAAFQKKAVSRREAGRRKKDTRYLLVAGGSIGAGSMERVLQKIKRRLRGQKDWVCIAVCGNNYGLYKKLKKKYGSDQQYIILGKTGCMERYMEICDLFLSKPGGLSSTEAAVLGVPLLHISPIPGCESRNLKFFAGRGMSYNSLGKKMHRQKELFMDDELLEQLRFNQKKYCKADAAGKICDFLENIKN